MVCRTKGNSVILNAYVYLPTALTLVNSVVERKTVRTFYCLVLLIAENSASICKQNGVRYNPVCSYAKLFVTPAMLLRGSVSCK